MAAACILLGTMGCNDDDYTGHSILKPTSPVITVTLPPQAELDDPDNHSFEVTITMSVEQVVDVAVYLLQADGDAVFNEDYAISWVDADTNSPSHENRVIVRRGFTTVKATVEILSNELNDGDKMLKLQIGDARTANAKITPVSMTIDRTP